MNKIILAAVVGLLLLVSSLVVLTNFYEGSGFFGLDSVFHLAGGVFAAWCSYLFFQYYPCKRLPIVLLILISGLSIGLIWEALEYTSSVFGPDYWPTIYRYYHSGGLQDTISDLVCDGVGIVFFILLYFRHES